MSSASVCTSAPFATVASITGRIVTCRTSGSIRGTISPPRCRRPRIGGLSFASVPRPGAPLSRRRRPGRPFLRPRPAGPCGRPRRGPRRSRPRLPAAPAGAWRRAPAAGPRSWPARRGRRGRVPGRSGGRGGSGPSGTGTTPRPAAAGGARPARCRSGRRSGRGTPRSGSVADGVGRRPGRRGRSWRPRNAGNGRPRASGAAAPARSIARHRSMTAGSRGQAWAAPRLVGRTLSQPLTALLGTLGPDHPETRQEPLQKRYLVHVAGYNLGLVMRLLVGAGTPREFLARSSARLLILTTADGAMLDILVVTTDA